MIQEPLTIHIDPESELARALAETDERQVVLDSDGVRYTVSREDIFAHYDPERVLEALRRSRGALRGVDIKQLLDDLRGQREQSPSDRTQ